MASDWWPVDDLTPPPPVAPIAPAYKKKKLASASDWWPDQETSSPPDQVSASSAESPNSSPPMDRPGDADYSPPTPTPTTTARPRRDMSQLGAGLRAAGAQPATTPAKDPHWWNTALEVAGDTLGGTANVVAGTLGRGASGAEKSVGGGVRFVGQALDAAGSHAGPLAPLLQGPGAVLQGVGGELENMGGRQVEEASQRLAGKPGADSIAAKAVEGIPMLTGMAATGGASALIPTAEMGLMGAGSGLQSAEEAGATPDQAATSALIQGASDAALGQVATVPLIGKMLHGQNAKTAAQALVSIAKQGGMGAVQAVGMDVLHHVGKLISGVSDADLDPTQIATNAAAQGILQAVFEAPTIEGARISGERFSGLNKALEAERAAGPGESSLPGNLPPEIAPPVDRRIDLATRKKVSEMSPEEMQRTLLTSQDVPALPNRRAYEEAVDANPEQAHASLDLDSMKFLNDHFESHDAGDALLRKFGETVKDAGINGYHLHGDEFAVLGDDPDHVEAQMQQLRAHMDRSGAHLEYEAPGGETYRIPMSYSYGIGESFPAADQAMYASKAEREAAGLRVPRGESPPGFTKIGGTSDQSNQITDNATVEGVGGQAAIGPETQEGAGISRNADGQDAGRRSAVAGLREVAAEGRQPADGGAENPVTQAPVAHPADTHYQVTDVSAEELAKADADKTGDYVPKESTLGTIPATTERDAIDQLKARVAAGEFPPDARLAPPIERSVQREVSNPEVAQQKGQEAVHEVHHAEGNVDDAQGGKDAKEGVLAEGRTTSLKNAVTSEERVARGLPEVEMAARHGNEAQWSEAKQRIAEDPELPNRLAQVVIEKPRPISGLENDILLHDRMRISLDHREAMDAEEKAMASGDSGALTEARVRRASAEAQMEVNDQAARLAGREWAHAGLARQKLIAEDYSPINLVRRYKVAAGGKEVPEAVREQLTAISNDLKVAQEVAAEKESTASEREGQRVVERQARSRGRKVDKAKLDSEYADLSKLFAAKANKPHAGLDPELGAIIAKMAKNRVQAGARGLGEVVDSIFNDVQGHVEGLEKSDVRDAISGEGATKKNATQDEATAELASIKRQARLIKRIEDLQEGVQGDKAGKRIDPPEVAALKEKLRETKKDLEAAEKPTDQQRLNRTKLRLEARIRDAERGLAPNEPRKPLPDTAEIASLRQKLAETLDEQGLSKEKAPRQMTDAQRIAALKNRLAKRQAELEEQLASGNFAKKARRPAVMDEESMAAQARVKELKLQADRIIKRQELANRTTTEKSLDWGTKTARAVKLTGMATLQKLFAAASGRTFVFTPMDEIMGSALSKIPGYSKVVERAPIEGGASASAIAKSWAEYFSRSTREDVLAHLHMEEGKLDLLHGKPKTDPNSWMDLFGHLHAAMKSPPKNAAFRLAMEKQALWYMKQGIDITEPAVAQVAKARAFEYANRQIFMSDHAFVKAFRSATSSLRRDGAKVSASGSDVLFPIVKVPVNYVAETNAYITGLPWAAGKTILALRRGIESLPPEQADNIVRLAKKGSVGSAMMALGAAGFASGLIKGGGFYRKGDHRAKDDAKPGDIRIGDWEIPHMILHHPAIEALQVGANMARLLQHHTKDEGFGSAAERTAMGVASEIPFFEEPIRLAKDIEEPKGASRLAGELIRGATIPPDIQRAAKIADEPTHDGAWDAVLKQFGWRPIETTKRSAPSMFEHPLSGVAGEEALGIPGARKLVPRR